MCIRAHVHMNNTVEKTSRGLSGAATPCVETRCSRHCLSRHAARTQQRCAGATWRYRWQASLHKCCLGMYPPPHMTHSSDNTGGKPHSPVMCRRIGRWRACCPPHSCTTTYVCIYVYIYVVCMYIRMHTCYVLIRPPIPYITSSRCKRLHKFCPVEILLHEWGRLRVPLCNVLKNVFFLKSNHTYVLCTYIVRPN